MDVLVVVADVFLNLLQHASGSNKSILEEIDLLVRERHSKTAKEHKGGT